jgi:disulfide bond formation protein DsbB
MKKINKDEKGMQNLIAIGLTIILVFVLLFMGVYVNGTIHTELADTYPGNEITPNASIANNWNNNVQNRSFNAMDNASGNFANTLDIVQVVIIISILAVAIGAIFLFTKFR